MPWFELTPNGKDHTDRRQNFTLAANPAFKTSIVSKLKRLAAVRVYPIVRPLVHRGLRSIGMIGGDVPTRIVPRTSNPCR